MKTLSAWRERLIDFFFPAESDTWLAVLRIGLGLQVVLYALSLRDDWNYLLAGTGRGLISRNLGEAILSLESHLIPRLGWFVALGTQVDLREETVLSVAWICLFAVGCSLLLGVACRFSAILAWSLHLCAAKSGGFVSYGVDNFMTIGLFYLMLSPLPDRYSLDWRLRKSRAKDPQWSRRAPGDMDGRALRPSERERASQLLGFWRRVLQLHLCLIYFFSGLTKCLGSGWWDGSNMWRALIRPPFNIINPEILAGWKYLFPAAGVYLHLCNARWDWTHDGNVSVCAHHDHPQRGGLRPRPSWGQRETLICSPTGGPRVGHWVQSSWADAGYLLSITGNGVAIFATE